MDGWKVVGSSSMDCCFLCQPLAPLQGRIQNKNVGVRTTVVECSHRFSMWRISDSIMVVITAKLQLIWNPWTKDWEKCNIRCSCLPLRQQFLPFNNRRTWFEARPLLTAFLEHLCSTSISLVQNWSQMPVHVLLQSHYTSKSKLKIHCVMDSWIRTLVLPFP